MEDCQAVMHLSIRYSAASVLVWGIDHHCHCLHIPGGPTSRTAAGNSEEDDGTHSASAAAAAAPALYSNTAEADIYLAKQSPDYMGGHAMLYHDR